MTTGACSDTIKMTDILRVYKKKNFVLKILFAEQYKNTWISLME